VALAIASDKGRRNMALLTYRDDRDKPVNPVNWRWHPTRRPCFAKISTSLRIALNDSLQRCVVPLSLLLFLSTTALATLIMFPALAGPDLKESFKLFPSDGVLIGIEIFAYTMSVGAMLLQCIVILTGRVEHRFREHFLSLSKCPACFCSMNRLPVEADGCVVCPNPECGAAWGLTDRIQQS